MASASPTAARGRRAPRIASCARSPSCRWRRASCCSRAPACCCGRSCNSRRRTRVSRRTVCSPSTSRSCRSAKPPIRFATSIARSGGACQTFLASRRSPSRARCRGAISETSVRASRSRSKAGGAELTRTIRTARRDRSRRDTFRRSTSRFSKAAISPRPIATTPRAWSSSAPPSRSGCSPARASSTVT